MVMDTIGKDTITRISEDAGLAWLAEASADQEQFLQNLTGLKEADLKRVAKKIFKHFDHYDRVELACIIAYMLVGVFTRDMNVHEEMEKWVDYYDQKMEA